MQGYTDRQVCVPLRQMGKRETIMKIAVVDDNPKDRGRLKQYIERYASEQKMQFEVFLYANGLDFLDDMGKNFDIVFMDIEMPHLDGIQTAKKMRETDDTTILVFITNLAQYAIHGYEVNAIEFMVKPVGYYNFSDKMAKALKYLRRNDEKIMLFKSGDIITKIPVSKILYLEKDKNYIVFHTEQGDYRERGSMSEIEEKLSGMGFSKCIAGCLVNLRYVSRMEKDVVWLKDIRLPVSRTQRKLFAKEFADFLGGELV